MTDQKRKQNKTRRAERSETEDGPTDLDLLRLYLKLHKTERGEIFADTARAAELTDLSQRTIQFWIETGAIRAVSIGKKYQVYLRSLDDYLRQQARKRAS